MDKEDTKPKQNNDWIQLRVKILGLISYLWKLECPLVIQRKYKTLNTTEERKKNKFDRNPEMRIANVSFLLKVGFPLVSWSPGIHEALASETDQWGRKERRMIIDLHYCITIHPSDNGSSQWSVSLEEFTWCSMYLSAEDWSHKTQQMLVIKKKSSRHSDNQRLMPGNVKNNDRINIICIGFGKTELTNTQS
jgi:hypothetical protein